MVGGDIIDNFLCGAGVLPLRCQSQSYPHSQFNVITAAEVHHNILGQQIVGNGEHYPIGGTNMGGAQADILNVTPTAVGSSQTLRQEDSVTDAKRFVHDDEDASDDILHRVLGGESDRQT